MLRLGDFRKLEQKLAASLPCCTVFITPDDLQTIHCDYGVNRYQHIVGRVRQVAHVIGHSDTWFNIIYIMRNTMLRIWPSVPANRTWRFCIS
jgi:hypothetical protein